MQFWTLHLSVRPLVKLPLVPTLCINHVAIMVFSENIRCYGCIIVCSETRALGKYLPHFKSKHYWPLVEVTQLSEPFFSPLPWLEIKSWYHLNESVFLAGLVNFCFFSILLCFADFHEWKYLNTGQYKSFFPKSIIQTCMFIDEFLNAFNSGTIFI